MVKRNKNPPWSKSEAVKRDSMKGFIEVTQTDNKIETIVPVRSIKFVEQDGNGAFIVLDFIYSKKSVARGGLSVVENLDEIEYKLEAAK